ncbi:unnamed protein product [Ceratitis capitata]|uniref:(Mediterranean fruit fly) hypothetical protein n=1 Tax=Ceratitis capitata TaxID=7213 RepID=A0A811U9Q8_CERCA|nr:unnamed protein product [Ceratitis capitata]
MLRFHRIIRFKSIPPNLMVRWRNNNADAMIEAQYPTPVNSSTWNADPRQLKVLPACMIALRSPPVN